jgi:hypothetical protein
MATAGMPLRPMPRGTAWCWPAHATGLLAQCGDLVIVSAVTASQTVAVAEACARRSAAGRLLPRLQLSASPGAKIAPPGLVDAAGAATSKAR